jgi:hypothetical protein
LNFGRQLTRIKPNTIELLEITICEVEVPVSFSFEIIIFISVVGKYLKRKKGGAVPEELSFFMDRISEVPEVEIIVPDQL